MPQLFVTGQHWALPVWVCCAQQCKVQWWPVTSSVPWGLILGPALFNVFINGEQPNLSKLGALCKHGWHSSGKGWKQHSWRSHCADQRRQKQTQHPVWDSPCTRKGWDWPNRNGIAETDMWVLLGEKFMMSQQHMLVQQRRSAACWAADWSQQAKESEAGVRVHQLSWHGTIHWHTWTSPAKPMWKGWKSGSASRSQPKGDTAAASSFLMRRRREDWTRCFLWCHNQRNQPKLMDRKF